MAALPFPSGGFEAKRPFRHRSGLAAELSVDNSGLRRFPQLTGSQTAKERPIQN